MQTWSTVAVPRQRQFAYWREMICEAFLDLTPDSTKRDGFRGRVAQRRLGHLDLARIDSQAQQVRRTEADIARSPNARYYANLQVRGTCLTIQDGRSVLLHPGDITVVDTSKPFMFDVDGDFMQLSLHVPADLLQAQVEQPVRTATRIPADNGVGAAIRHALHAMEAGRLETSAAARLAVHACGLLAVALEQPAPESPSARHHSRLRNAALDDIDEHLGDDDLCPAVTARRLGISVRLLHQLFAGRERTYGAEVRRRRLERASRDLRDPARAALRIADIAADAGFADVTHFHRAFRQAYGCTPAQARRGVAP